MRVTAGLLGIVAGGFFESMRWWAHDHNAGMAAANGVMVGGALAALIVVCLLPVRRGGE